MTTPASLRSLLPLLLLTAACSGDTALAPCAGDGSCPSGYACNAQSRCEPVAGQDVLVRAFTRFHTAAGVTSVAATLAPPVEVLVPDGGTLTSIPALMEVPGAYRAAGVPEGLSYVRAGKVFVATSARAVDLSTHALGRSDLGRASASTAAATVTVSGLEPWDSQHTLSLASGDVDLAGGVTLASPPQAGQTSLSAAAATYAPFDGAGVPLLEADSAWLLQTVRRQQPDAVEGSGTLDYGAVARAQRLESLRYTGTTPLQLQATLQPLADRQLSLQWERTSFDGHRASIAPDATFTSSHLSVTAAAHGLEGGWTGRVGNLLSIPSASSPQGDVSAVLTYGNPFPASWPELVVVRHRYAVTYSAPGSTTALQLYASLESVDPLESVTGRPLQPRLTPPRSLALDGSSGHTAHTLGSTTPRIHWEAPAVGQPQRYVLSLYQVGLKAGSADARVATFHLPATQTELQLPPGLLQAGAHYALSLTAHAGGGSEWEKALHSRPVPSASATTLSALLSTP